MAVCVHEKIDFYFPSKAEQYRDVNLELRNSRTCSIIRSIFKFQIFAGSKSRNLFPCNFGALTKCLFNFFEQAERGRRPSGAANLLLDRVQFVDFLHFTFGFAPLAQFPE